jgi:hypothetical protein
MSFYLCWCQIYGELPMTRLQRFVKFLIIVNTLLHLFSSIGLKLDLVRSFKESPLAPPSQTCTK